jgi:hypothetical protein
MIKVDIPGIVLTVMKPKYAFKKYYVTKNMLSKYV